MEPPHGIDINEHLDLIQMVAASMPRAKWLLSPDVFPQVQSEGWLGLYEALKKFDPAKGNPDKTVTQRFRIYAPNRIKNLLVTDSSIITMDFKLFKFTNRQCVTLIGCRLKPEKSLSFV